MFPTNKFRKGLKLELDGTPFEIVDFQHVSPGKGGAFTRTKLKNLLNQNMTEKTFKSGEVVPRANTEERTMQYLYNDSQGFHFMDTRSYEQLTMAEEQLGKEKIGLLQEQAEISVMFFNERPIAVELPTFVAIKVTRTDPAHRGNTVSGSGKPAQLETGATVTVPFHIKEGDTIKVDTRECSYVEKVNK